MICHQQYISLYRPFFHRYPCRTALFEIRILTLNRQRVTEHCWGLCRTYCGVHNTACVLLNTGHIGNISSGANQSCNHTSVCSPQGFGSVIAYSNAHPYFLRTAQPQRQCIMLLKFTIYFEIRKLCLL